MRWLITGSGGLLGREVVEVLAGEEVSAMTHQALDISDPVAVAKAVNGHDTVINCAGYTKVDLAEANEAEATAVNGHGVWNLARACAHTGATLLHVSSDYVFSGTSRTPYREDAAPGPLNAYGRSKLVGEMAVLHLLPRTGYVVRTAWLYGTGGPCFVATMLRLAAERETVSVVDDQFGQPTWARDLAGQLVALGRCRDAPPGIYHGTSGGSTTWFGLAKELFRLSGLAPERVLPIPAVRFPLPAQRPVYTVLGHERWQTTGIRELGPWHDRLRLALEESNFNR
ncbi:dTDP-4-dehydrorhamnose reductase [Kitasatospora sp. NPDC059747]|uniref:dTDP-4-dehydrorhamnose reductase n=1 Tax=Kitasatospora sp. NPDC059747 TaxID=3346930 RepID=UPI00365D0AC5